MSILSYKNRISYPTLKIINNLSNIISYNTTKLNFNNKYTNNTSHRLK